jgi:hypothetical protein
MATQQLCQMLNLDEEIEDIHGYTYAFLTA